MSNDKLLTLYDPHGPLFCTHKILRGHWRLFALVSCTRLHSAFESMLSSLIVLFYRIRLYASCISYRRCLMNQYYYTDSTGYDIRA